MGSLEKLRACLLKAVPSVTYGPRERGDGEEISPPYAVYQELGKRAPAHADDLPCFMESKVQVSLVTKAKSPEDEGRLEKALIEGGYPFSAQTEYQNSDRTLCRVYEVTLEEF